MLMLKTNRRVNNLSTSLNRIRDAQERLLRDDNDGDFTVQCGDTQWKCSGALLAQRCGFFRAVMKGSFSESVSKVIELHEETKEEVDMLLLYLYTLSGPDFFDGKRYKHQYTAAESALKLGDKYNLPDLSVAGKDYILNRLQCYVRDWHLHSTVFNGSVMTRLGRLWKMEYPEAESLREVAVTRLVTIAKYVIEFQPFQKLCAEEPGFALDFMRAQAQAAAEKASSTGNSDG